MLEYPKGENQEKLIDFSEFHIQEVLDEGAYGQISKAVWRNDVVALKRLKSNREEKHIINEH
ncbi:23672_t:CDS:2 [Cetraspora pellucida]|uniref:23672_t:CDS:1 n=1 Tax=Cetraspora pellucida TaxID=1433469 RepID=A0A9N8WK63_9GLOM|nr:23672_t:CDS:2 [Cetraspora pellucida]